MPKADCVHSTPPTDASKSTVGAPSAGQLSPLSLIPASRPDASQAFASECEPSEGVPTYSERAGGTMTRRTAMNMIVGTGVLTAAASEIKTSVTQPDAILKLIADHKAATAASDEAAHHYSNLEETLPADRCGGGLACDVKKFANDDPRWTEASHRLNAAIEKADEIALAMLDTPITSFASLTALVAYAGEYVEQGYLWPTEIIDKTVDDEPRDWERWVFMKAAETMRQLSSVAS